MGRRTESDRQHVVVVTGGSAGIGRAIAQELGRRGTVVVTLDPGVTVDGSASDRRPAQRSTVESIVAAGGRARASDASVADVDAVMELFRSLADEFGAVDGVVNAAGIIRRTDFVTGSEQDWSAVLDVHLNGYLNVLRAALPVMAQSGHGRVLGVTSGSGWRPANGGAYGCAKRAVAALTWQIGDAVPHGVTVNALSPIALTRMILDGLPPGAPGQEASEVGRTGGLSLGSLPAPEDIGPIGADLATHGLGWSSGNVIFSNGGECALVEPPRLLEALRTREVEALAPALATAIPATFVPAEVAQACQGGSNARVGNIFEGSGAAASAAGRVCLVVSDDASWSHVLAASLAARGVRCLSIGAGDGPQLVSRQLAEGFDAVDAQIAAVAAHHGPVDAVVVGLRRAGRPATDPGWEGILAAHDGVADEIRGDAAWFRGVGRYAAAVGRPVRTVMLVDATDAGGRCRAHAATQLSRSAHAATAGRVDACTVGLESTAAADVDAAATLVGHLVCGPDTSHLSGAELMVGSGWLGLRSHPRPSGSISFGGPAVPDWVDSALREMCGSGSNR